MCSDLIPSNRSIFWEKILEITEIKVTANYGRNAGEGALIPKLTFIGIALTHSHRMSFRYSCSGDFVSCHAAMQRRPQSKAISGMTDELPEFFTGIPEFPNFVRQWELNWAYKRGNRPSWLEMSISVLWMNWIRWKLQWDVVIQIPTSAGTIALKKSALLCAQIAYALDRHGLGKSSIMSS